MRDVRDQLAALCERVEVTIESNPNSSDIIPIQKALTSGYCASPFSLEARLSALTWSRFLVFNTARLHRDGGYRTTKNSQSRSHISSWRIPTC